MAVSNVKTYIDPVTGWFYAGECRISNRRVPVTRKVFGLPDMPGWPPPPAQPVEAA